MKMLEGRRGKRFGSQWRKGEVGQQTEAAKNHQRMRRAVKYTRRIPNKLLLRETQVSTGPGAGDWLVTWKQICHVPGQLVLLLGLPSLVHWVVPLALLCGTFEITFPLACQTNGTLSLFRIFFLGGRGECSPFLSRLSQIIFDNSCSFLLPMYNIDLSSISSSQLPRKDREASTHRTVNASSSPSGLVYYIDMASGTGDE